MANVKVGQVGFGYLGKAYHNHLFKDSIVYDPYSEDVDLQGNKVKDTTREQINSCQIAIVAVPTDPLPSGELNMSIIEETIKWLKTPLILIMSALNPGTTERLVGKTGKRIAVGVETIGMGNYAMPYWKYPHPTDPSLHQFLIIGGEEETARRCADAMWNKMSPSIDIHLVSSTEAEICKLWENWWGSLKVTMSNMIYDLCEANGANYTKVLQAWGADGRVEKMHCRVVPGKRGYFSHCYQKDIPALSAFSVKSGINELAEFINMQEKINKQHLKLNHENS